MTTPLVLIVDDEPDICELLELTLGRMNINTYAAQTLEQARNLLNQHKFDFCLTDMRLPDGNGIELVEYIQTNFDDTPSAVITAHGSMESAIQALKAGAFDFVSKPVDLKVLRNLVNTALKIQSTEKFPYKDRRTRFTLLGESDIMNRLRGTIAKLARSQAPVYISGESGTGKELVARMIHEKGPRSDQEFVPVNCGAIPNELMESEFFGHKKGSFTGATGDKPGLFRSAHGGTLFLDEVADLPMHMQVKLLRAIQEKAVRPIGESQEVSVDVRILSATHKDLAMLVEQGKFRQDLYYRINVIEVDVPPLRERASDILQLAEYILERLAIQIQCDKPTISSGALLQLQSYTFPGNVRELENILERSLTLCEDNVIHSDDLQLSNTASVFTPAIASKPAAVKVKNTQAALEMVSSGETCVAEKESLPLEDYLDSIEKDAIVSALSKTNNNKTAAARILGMSFRSLRYRLKKLGLD